MAWFAEHASRNVDFDGAFTHDVRLRNAAHYRNAAPFGKETAAAVARKGGDRATAGAEFAAWASQQHHRVRLRLRLRLGFGFRLWLRLQLGLRLGLRLGAPARAPAGFRLGFRFVPAPVPAPLLSPSRLGSSQPRPRKPGGVTSGRG